MKKKLIALLAAVAMVFSLAACGSTPDSVGTIGTVDITSGLYLLAQYDAYQKAADLAASEQDATDVKAFLKQTITVDADSGETATVSDYVSQKTMENLETYAAIETRFEELGGQLTAEEEAQADSYASQLMEQNGDLYKANGIGLDTLKRFERILIKSNDLLEMCYGIDTPLLSSSLPVFHGSDPLREHCNHLFYPLPHLHHRHAEKRLSLHFEIHPFAVREVR